MRFKYAVQAVGKSREQNRGYPRLKPTARYREQRSKAGQDSGQMSGFDAREAAN
ncbi:hypothetical protein [Thermoleptolyngbya sp.]